MITVAFTVSGLRPKYLRAAIESWYRARGSDQVGFAFLIEPSTGFPVAAFRGYVERTFPDRAHVSENPRRLGCLINTRQAISTAVTLSEEGFGVVAEEDLEVADDIIEYLTWARDAYREDERVVGICCHAQASQVEDVHGVALAHWFNPLVWGTWRDRWEGFMAPRWGAIDGNQQGWDRNMQLKVQEAGKLCAFPARSRSVHRGETSTITPAPLSEYFYRAFLSDCFEPHYAPGSYHEIPYPDGRMTV